SHILRRDAPRRANPVTDPPPSAEERSPRAFPGAEVLAQLTGEGRGYRTRRGKAQRRPSGRETAPHPAQQRRRAAAAAVALVAVAVGAVAFGPDIVSRGLLAPRPSDAPGEAAATAAGGETSVTGRDGAGKAIIFPPHRSAASA